MPNLDEKMSALAEQVLKRPLTEDEQLEMYKISDAMGMGNIQSFLHQLLVFKLYEDILKTQFKELGAFETRLNERFQEMSESESRINQTLESSVDRVLGEGAKRIGADMGEEIASHAKTVFAGVGAYYLTKGQIIVACLFWPTAVLAYWLGYNDILRIISGGRIFQALLHLPAGWCFLICGMTYTFLWIGDNWHKIRKRLLFKTLLGIQVFGLLILALVLLQE